MAKPLIKELHVEKDNDIIIDGEIGANMNNISAGEEHQLTNDLYINGNLYVRNTTENGNKGRAIFGYNTVASGDNSLAEGNSTIASGDSSHAEGYQTSAINKYSHAEGRNTQAVGENSHVEGYMTYSVGTSSHAEGDESVAQGLYSHAEGNGTGAIGNSSHAEGYQSGAIGQVSHAEGYKTIASGEGSHAEGGYSDEVISQSTKYATASGRFSHAEGTATLAYGQGSHAEGDLTTATGDNSHAEGSSSTAVGGHSHAEGSGTIANASASHAEGVTTTVGNVAQGGHAEGRNTKVYSTYGHAEGDGCVTGLANGSKGAAAHTEGGYTIANADYQHVQGKYNIADNTKIHIVGWGTAEENRKNIHTIDTTGNGWYLGDVQTDNLFTHKVATIDEETGETTISYDPIQGDWNEIDTTLNSYIKNKPTSLAQFTDDSTHRLVTDTDITNWNNAAGQGSQSDWEEEDPTSLAYIKNKPELPAGGAYVLDVTVDGVSVLDTSTKVAAIDLSGKQDTIPQETLNQWNAAEANVKSDWNETSYSSDAFILNKPTNLSQFNEDSTHRLVTDTEKTTWNTQSDWSQIDTTAIDYIKNKPTNLSDFNEDTTHRLVTDSQIANWNAAAGTSAKQSDWNETDTTDLAYILNKPSIPNALTDLSDFASYDSNLQDTITNLQVSVRDCFTSVSNGKALVASAITDKGVSTASDATFNTMAENIRNIPSGGEIIYIKENSVFSVSKGRVYVKEE